MPGVRECKVAVRRLSALRTRGRTPPHVGNVTSIGVGEVAAFFDNPSVSVADSSLYTREPLCGRILNGDVSEVRGVVARFFVAGSSE